MPEDDVRSLQGKLSEIMLRNWKLSTGGEGWRQGGWGLDGPGGGGKPHRLFKFFRFLRHHRCHPYMQYIIKTGGFRE